MLKRSPSSRNASVLTFRTRYRPALRRRRGPARARPSGTGRTTAPRSPRPPGAWRRHHRVEVFDGRHLDRFTDCGQDRPHFLHMAHRRFVTERDAVLLLAGRAATMRPRSSICAMVDHSRDSAEGSGQTLRPNCLRFGSPWELDTVAKRSNGSVRDRELAGHDRPGAGQEAATREVADLDQDAEKDDELDTSSPVRPYGTDLPEQPQNRLRDRTRPRPSRRNSAARDPRPGSTLDTRQHAERTEKPDRDRRSGK